MFSGCDPADDEGIMRDKQPVGTPPVYCLRTASPTAEAWPPREGLEKTDKQNISAFIRWSEKKTLQPKALTASSQCPAGTKTSRFYFLILTKSHETTEKPGAGTKLFILGDLNELRIITITISPSLHTVKNL